MVYTSQVNWNKILGYAEETYDSLKAEVGGMAVVVEDKESDWEIINPVILKQEVSSGNCVLDKDALAEYYTRTAKKMGKKDFRFCWWHSHHTMAAFWSSTDLKAIDEYNDGDFSFALVVNLKGEYKLRVSVWKPVEVHEDVELTILGLSRVTKAIKKDVEKYCDKELSTWKKPGYNHHSGYSYTTGYKSADQTNIPFNRGRSIVPYQNGSYKSKMVYGDICEEVDDIISETVTGTIQHKEYAILIDELNKKLKDEESLYKVETLPENKVNDLLTMLPFEFISYRSTGHKVYTEDPNTNMYHGFGY